MRKLSTIFQTLWESEPMVRAMCRTCIGPFTAKQTSTRSLPLYRRDGVGANRDDSAEWILDFLSVFRGIAPECRGTLR